MEHSHYHPILSVIAVVHAAFAIWLPDLAGIMLHVHIPPIFLESAQLGAGIVAIGAGMLSIRSHFKKKK